ncbi:MAG: DUF371 domain-containing protein [Candidatus Lokiarchaeota archaeon]|nr:DUF371 domain-containing protein [Candidatus Lokiarchaeota archaeon]
MKLVKIDEFKVYGHKNVRGTHKSTLEFTRESFLTPKGDCILGIKSEKSCENLSARLKTLIQAGKKFLIRLSINGHQDEFTGEGNEKLNLFDKEDLVFRKSNYKCNRTCLIKCSKAAVDIDREIINELQNPEGIMLVEVFSMN